MIPTPKNAFIRRKSFKIKKNCLHCLIFQEVCLPPALPPRFVGATGYGSVGWPATSVASMHPFKSPAQHHLVFPLRKCAEGSRQILVKNRHVGLLRAQSSFANLQTIGLQVPGGKTLLRRRSRLICFEWEIQSRSGSRPCRNIPAPEPS